MSQSLWPPSDLAGTVRLDGLPPSTSLKCRQNRLSGKCSLNVFRQRSEHANEFLMVFCSDAA